jgi:hypothetical protein
MEMSVEELFRRYEQAFQEALHGEADMDQVASLYACEFIAASPAGIRAGKNDDQFKQAMAQGYAHYREIGTRQMRKRDLRVSPMDEHHCVAHVAWTATYSRKGEPDVTIDFDVHYLVQTLDGEPKIFGWISGDEQAVLKRHGII